MERNDLKKKEKRKGTEKISKQIDEKQHNFKKKTISILLGIALSKINANQEIFIANDNNSTHSTIL